MSEAKRAVIYARTAISQELGPNFPMANQIHECKEYATREGYEVVEEFQEVGSGSGIDRPILKAVLIAAEEGKFDVLIIRSFDRLSRNSGLAADVIKAFEGYGVKVLSVTEDVAMNHMIAAIQEEVGRIEREMMASRARAGRQAKRNRQEG